MRIKTYFILDKSSSMGDTKKQTVSGYNEHVQELRKRQRENPEDQFLVSLVTFNGEVYEHLWEQPVTDIELLTEKTYHPDGSTALLDAVGYVLSKITDDNESNYLFIIITDGEENSSRRHNYNSVQELITNKQNTNRFTFTYLGCNSLNARTVAQNLNIPIGNVAVWSNQTATKCDTSLKKARLRGLNNYLRQHVAAKLDPELMVSTNAFYGSSTQNITNFAESDGEQLISSAKSLPRSVYSTDKTSNLTKTNSNS